MPQSPADEIEALKEYTKTLKQQLEDIQRRIDELQGKDK